MKAPEGAAPLPPADRNMSADEVIKMRWGAIPDSAVRRMGRYMRAVERLEAGGVTVISSTQLGDMLGYTASQVRQDLNYFGKYGLQGFGYAVGLLHDDLIHIFGADRGFPAAVVGAGHIGSYLLERSVLQKCGLRVLWALDAAPERQGQVLGGVAVRDMGELPELARSRPVLFAALCVPPEAAQEAADALISHGVKAIWNITGRDLTLPRGVLTESAHLEDSLLSIGYRLRESEGGRSRVSGE